MSSKTSDNESLSPKKHPLRLQLPADDAIVDAFMAAQGARFQSQAIVMLIRMWVNEFGATNVMEQTMGALTTSSLKERVSATQATAAQLVTAPKQPEVPAPCSSETDTATDSSSLVSAHPSDIRVTERRFRRLVSQEEQLDEHRRNGFRTKTTYD